MLLKRQSSLYVRDLPPIRLVDAEEELEADRLFAESQSTLGTQPSYPRSVIRTSVVIEGYVLDLELADMSLGEVLSMLRRRGAVPVAPQTVATVEPTPAAPATPVPAPAPDLLAPNSVPRGLSVFKRREYRAEIYEARRIRGRWLKEQCKALKLPHKELARRIGVAPARITAYCSGDACAELIWRKIEDVLGRRYDPTT